MTENLIKYNKIFQEAFAVDEYQLATLKLKESENWDSVAHIGLIAELENVFSINIEFEDMFNLVSYNTGLEILNQNYHIEF